jgi:hypothetical protein
MAKKYDRIRTWAKTNPGLPAEMREFFTAIDASVSWPTTTTTTTTAAPTTTTT